MWLVLLHALFLFSFDIVEFVLSFVSIVPVYLSCSWLCVCFVCRLLRFYVWCERLLAYVSTRT